MVATNEPVTHKYFLVLRAALIGGRANEPIIIPIENAITVTPFLVLLYPFISLRNGPDHKLLTSKNAPSLKK